MGPIETTRPLLGSGINLRVRALVRGLPWLLASLTACSDDASISSATDAGTGGASDATTADTGSAATSNAGTDGETATSVESTTSAGTTSDTSSSAGETETSGTTAAGGAPTAADDTFFTAQNQALVVAAPGGVIANDSGPDGLSVTAFDAASPGGAVVEIAADGSLTYAPADGFWGPDSFAYTIADPWGESASATVTVFVAPRQIPLAEVTAGNGGFALNGESENDYSGASVSGGPDMNRDGMDDIILGAQGADPNGSFSGRSYVVFGKANGTTVELSALATGGFVINGQAALDTAGVCVSGAADINGDGISDLIVGARGSSHSGDNTGRGYVVFGKADVAAVELGALGAGGFVLDGEAMSDNAGFSVSNAGDVNGDGLEDLIVGAYGADPNGDRSGRSYVVFGKADVTAVDLGALGAGGFVIDGAAAGDNSGRAVSGAGDINGDGMDDLIVGSPFANGAESGRSHVVFGKANASPVELNALGAGGFVLNGEAAGDRSGGSVSGAGDVNGDGMDDLIVGAGTANPNGGNSGRSYVVFGKADVMAVELGALGAGGFVLNGEVAGDEAGGAVSGAGDVNGDGMDDLIVGSINADFGGINSGRVYVVFGKADVAPVELGDLGAGGFVLTGEIAGDRAGRSVSGAGDVNGDGVDDVIVGADGAAPNGTRSGRTYVVFGVRTQ